MTIPVVAETAIAHYLSKGLTKDVSIGLVAPLYYESKLSTDSQGVQTTETPGVLNPSGAYGIASWNGPRQQALMNFANKKGWSASDLNTQLDFVLTESANSYPVVWKAIQDPTINYTDFINTFVTHYEIPADIPKEVAAALNYAKTWYPESIIPTSIPPTTVPPISTTNPNLSIIVTLAEAIIKLAQG